VALFSAESGALAIMPPVWLDEVICPLFTQFSNTTVASVVILPTIPAPYDVEPEGIVTFALLVIFWNVIVFVFEAFIEYATGVLDIELEESPGISTVKFLIVAPAPTVLKIVPDVVMVCPFPSNVPVNVVVTDSPAGIVISAVSLYEPEGPPQLLELRFTLSLKVFQLETENVYEGAAKAPIGKRVTINAKASSNVDARFRIFVFINFSFLKT
jgi:hypothetical protein